MACAPLLITLTLLQVFLQPAAADGFVGCLFSKALCQDEVEWCFDDYAFGRCLPHYGDEDEADLYRYDLQRDALHLLERQMEHLFKLGYRWSHLYTQCVLQTLLHAFRHQVDYDDAACSALADQDLNAALKVLEGEVEQHLDPQRVAHVEFTPSMGNPHAEYADEIYVPLKENIDLGQLPTDRDEELGPSYLSHATYYDKPKRSKNHRRMREDYQITPEDLLYLKELADEEEEISRILPIEEPKLKQRIHFSERYNTPDNFRQGVESKDYLEEVISIPKSFSRNYNTPDNFRMGFESKDDQLLRSPASYLEGSFHTSPESRELVYDNYRNEKEEESDLRDLAAVFGTDRKAGDNVEGVYTEGGMVYLKDTDREKSSEPNLDDLVETMGAFGFGFKRPERLDVKKPGPEFNTNNYAFKQDKDDKETKKGKPQHLPETATINSVMEKAAAPQPLLVQKLEKKKPTQRDADNSEPPELIYLQFKDTVDSWKKGAHIVREVTKFLNLPPNAISHARVDDERVTFRVEPNKLDLNASEAVKILDANKDKISEAVGMEVTDAGIVVPTPLALPRMEKKKVGSPLESPILKKPPLHDADSGEQADFYTYLQFKDRVNSWEEGARIVRGVAKFLNLEPNAFSHTRVDDTQVTFKVEPNRLNLNASEVAKRIDANKDKMREDLGLEVTATGIGDKDKLKLPSVTSLSPEDEHQLWVVSFLLCGLIAAVAIAGAALFVIKRHAHTRDKLQGLGQPDTEASKDYQDLCRARMATKSVSEKPEGGGIMGQRINNLARESEGSNQSPSSRSSTSSWSEEPALTNMDISTGHMVLSYMEDHLKNKDRLEQEWVALCAYEAEPCATTVAQKPENNKKNRYNDVLPYDHARVVLNELANITGSDYINASTITDHDPRNPAYIATQGPLSQTTPDLWQMVWEQGSVVMVMLTRLTENGSAMCHRYWPEEGSELYHIYEVHLVSEHVWCDDYLVRSFYLKNLKTGETRTVTQFHFLSWPENGVPLSTKALLEFRRKVNKSYRGRSCPIVVHCSDGVGRTGTYCLIDMVLNRMAKGAKEIDIAATLEHIRDQRPMMVRTKQQFEFVLMAVAEEVHAILKALPANHSPPPVLKEKE